MLNTRHHTQHYRQAVKTRYTLSDYLGAALFALCIAAPFAGFFYIYGA